RPNGRRETGGTRWLCDSKLEDFALLLQMDVGHIKPVSSPMQAENSRMPYIHSKVFDPESGASVVGTLGVISGYGVFMDCLILYIFNTFRALDQSGSGISNRVPLRVLRKAIM